MAERYSTELNFYSRNSRSKSRQQIYSLNDTLSEKIKEKRAKQSKDHTPPHNRTHERHTIELVNEFKELNNVANQRKGEGSAKNTTPQRLHTDQQHIHHKSTIVHQSTSKDHHENSRAKKSAVNRKLPNSPALPMVPDSGIKGSEFHHRVLSDRLKNEEEQLSESKANNPHTRDESMRQSDRFFDQISSIYRYPSEQEQVNNSGESVRLPTSSDLSQVFVPTGAEGTQEGLSDFAETGRFGSPRPMENREFKMPFQDTFYKPMQSSKKKHGGIQSPEPIALKLAVSISITDSDASLKYSPKISVQTSPEILQIESPHLRKDLLEHSQSFKKTFQTPERNHQIETNVAQQLTSSPSQKLEEKPIVLLPPIDDTLSFKERVEKRLSELDVDEDEPPPLIQMPGFVAEPILKQSTVQEPSLFEPPLQLEYQMEALYNKAFSAESKHEYYSTKTVTQLPFRPFQTALDKLTSLRERILTTGSLPPHTRERLLISHASISQTLASQQQIVQASKTQLQSKLDELTGRMHLASGGINWETTTVFLGRKTGSALDEQIALNKVILVGLVSQMSVLARLVREDRFF